MTNLVVVGIVGASLIVITVLALITARSVSRRGNQRSAEFERLQLRRQQFIAEQRLQRIVGDGFTRLLEASRRGRD